MLRSSPMKRGTSQLKRSGPIKAKRKARPKINGIDYLALCRGQECFLMLPMVRFHDRATVVPCHSNQSRHGKGMGIKASDVFTVPGCFECHYQIDQGKDMTREERFSAWGKAFDRWKSYRDQLLAQQE